MCVYVLEKMKVTLFFFFLFWFFPYTLLLGAKEQRTLGKQIETGRFSLNTQLKYSDI